MHVECGLDRAHLRGGVKRCVICELKHKRVLTLLVILKEPWQFPLLTMDYSICGDHFRVQGGAAHQVPQEMTKPSVSVVHHRRHRECTVAYVPSLNHEPGERSQRVALATEGGVMVGNDRERPRAPLGGRTSAS